MTTVARARSAAQLLFPAAVAVVLSIAALVPGALAFNIRDTMTLGPAEIGGLVALFYLLSSVFTQIAMPLASRMSPTTTVRFGLALGTVALLVPGIVGSKPSLVAMVVLAGVANGLATPAANMLIALTVPSHRRGLAFGLRVSAVPGSAAITALGAWVVAHSSLSWRAVTLSAAALCLSVLLISLLATKASPVPASPKGRDGRADGLGSLRVLALGGLLAATACSTLSPFLVEGLIAGGASAGAAALLLGCSAWLGVAARITAGIVADRVPRPGLQLGAASAMLVIAAVGMVGLGLFRGTAALAVATLLTFSIGWAWPGLLQQATLTLHPLHLAKATSYVQMGTYVGALVGPLGFGLLVEAGSFRLAWLTAAATAALAAATILLGLRVSRRRQT